MKLEITVTLAANASTELLGFAPVEGKWEVSDATCQHLVNLVASEEASQLVRGEAGSDEFKVELFRDDGRSLDGSDGIHNGSLLVTRRV